MKYRSSVVQGADWQDLNADGRVSFGELVLSTFFVVALVFVGLLVLAVAGGGLLAVPFGDLVAFLLRWWVWVALTASTLAGIALGVASGFSCGLFFWFSLVCLCSSAAASSWRRFWSAFTWASRPSKPLVVIPSRSMKLGTVAVDPISFSPR